MRPFRPLGPRTGSSGREGFPSAQCNKEKETSMVKKTSLPTSGGLYRDFYVQTEDIPGAEGLIEELRTGMKPEEYRLPCVTTAADALAVAQVFRTIYVRGNPYRSPLGEAAGGVATDLFGSLGLMLAEYMPPEECTFGSMGILLEMESVDRKVSALDLLFEQISRGLRYTPADCVDACDRRRVIEEDEARRLTGRGVPKGDVCLWSNMRRKSDGKMPARNVHADGSHGFTAEEDDAVALYQRYREAAPAERLAAVEELRAALAYAADPRRHHASDVTYSLLDALEASACRSLMRADGCSESLLRESMLGLTRSMEALRREEGQKEVAL